MPRMISYKCSNGHEHERFVSPEVTQSQCPRCYLMAEKAIAVPAIHYKGSGWTIKRKVRTEDDD
ncbi:MAG: hypothetical protein KAJ19_22840 [Gammaproteobacteria bacterium]|nr:hypothetical protein [Gammaproteobacteria bacterium]